MDPSDAIVNAIMSEGPGAIASSANVAYPQASGGRKGAPRARGERLPVKGYKFRKQQQKKLDIVNRMVKGEGTRPRLPPDVVALVKKHLDVKPLFKFIEEFKTFKVEETTENNFKIQFPNVLKHLFPTISWQDLDKSYEDGNAYHVGKLEIDYDMLISKLELMGLDRSTMYGTGSGENIIKIYNDGFVHFGRSFKTHFGKTIIGVEIIGEGESPYDLGTRVLIFVSPKKPRDIYVFVRSSEN